MYYDYKQNTVVPQTPEESQQLLDLIEKYLGKYLHTEKVIKKLLDEVMEKMIATVVVKAKVTSWFVRPFEIVPKPVKMEHVAEEIARHYKSFVEYSTAEYTERLQRTFNFGENTDIVDLCPPPLLILPLSRTIHGTLHAFHQCEKVFGQGWRNLGASMVLKYKEKMLIDLDPFCEDEDACAQITEIVNDVFDVDRIFSLLEEYDAIPTDK